VGHAPAYGADAVTEEALELFRAHFGGDAEVYFCFNGTGTNVVGLPVAPPPLRGRRLRRVAHINVDECGAPERFLGSKLLAVATPDGKLHTGTGLLQGAGRRRRAPCAGPGRVGHPEHRTRYRLPPRELAALSDWAHAQGMLVHLDGARIANAAASLASISAMFGRASGVDVVSFGGTKNGALGAEAVVTFRPEATTSLRFLRKQSMQLSSKMRFVAAQFVAS